MSSVHENTQKLLELVGQGQAAEAIRQFYADDVEIIEATGETWQGMETQLKRLEEWQSGIQEIHDGGISAVTVNEDTGVSMVESWMDITVKGGTRTNFEEVEVYNWSPDDKITRARFYYNAPNMGNGAGN